jgi:hypothetical protein
MTAINNVVGLLGHYFGEPEIEKLLSDFNITAVPRLKRGETTDIVVNEALGIEVTFRDARALDVRTKQYPKGALVLSNIRFYGVRTEDYVPYTGELPLGMKFGASRQMLMNQFGTPAWDSSALQSIRWDFDGYCIFVTLDDNGRMIIFDVQLPVA